MKNERQEKILSIIVSKTIETQEQLIAELKRLGVRCTQATISRDIKQLHLVKEPTGDGRYGYAASAHRTPISFADRLQKILRESIVSVDSAQNLVVLKTMPGLAGAAGAAFDGMTLEQLVGTIAGDDTVLLIMRDTASASELREEIAEMHK